jgi:hypothetical protein
MNILRKLRFMALVAVIPVSTKFVGVWSPIDVSNLHPWMKGKIEFAKDEKDPLVLMKSGYPMNKSWERDIVDDEKVKYHITTNVESFLDGKKIVVASIWKKMDGKASETLQRKSISIMFSTYELTDDNTLIFEKYGYSSGETKGQFSVEPYSKEFPQNYHTTYKRER